MEDKKIDRLVDYIVKKELDIQIGIDMDGKTCFIADWNKFDILESYLNRLEDVTIMWDDNYNYCENCYRFFEALPRYYGDQSHMAVWLSDYEYVCIDCVREFMEDIIDYYKNDYKKAIPTALIEDIKSQGFICLGDIDNNVYRVFETGWHEGQNDDPKAVIEELKNQGVLDVYDYIFALTDIGQFDVHFALFLKRRVE